MSTMTMVTAWEAGMSKPKPLVIISPCGEIVRWDFKRRVWVDAPELAHFAVIPCAKGVKP